MRPARRLWWTAPAAVYVLSACGKTPEETEKARGVLEGVNVVLAMSVLFIVGALAVVGGAIVLDRMVRSRRALADVPEGGEEETEEEDEVVAGISVGRASPPRWLYAAYVLIPAFAMAYVFSNVAVAPAQPTETEAPTDVGPCTECTITASGIKFDKSTLEVAASAEITVTFDNQDAGTPHDWAVFESEADAPDDPVAKTPTFPGAAEREVSFTSPAAGTTWFFMCTVHPAMTGDLEAVAAEG